MRRTRSAVCVPPRFPGKARPEFRHLGRTPAAAWRTSLDNLPGTMPQMTAKERPQIFGARQFTNATDPRARGVSAGARAARRQRDQSLGSSFGTRC